MEQTATRSVVFEYLRTSYPWKSKICVGNHDSQKSWTYSLSRHFP